MRPGGELAFNCGLSIRFDNFVMHTQLDTRGVWMCPSTPFESDAVQDAIPSRLIKFILSPLQSKHGASHFRPVRYLIMCKSNGTVLRNFRRIIYKQISFICQFFFFLRCCTCTPRVDRKCMFSLTYHSIALSSNYRLWNKKPISRAQHGTNAADAFWPAVSELFKLRLEYTTLDVHLRQTTSKCLFQSNQ